MNHKLWNIGSTAYACVAGMFYIINGKFTMGKLKSYPLSYIFVLNKPSLSNTLCRSRYEAYLAVLVVSFISSSMVYMRSIKSGKHGMI
jgi:hypothetical protein